MTTRASQFRADALRARRALAAQRPSSARGRQAKTLALTAFSRYATAGRYWVSTGKARLRGQRAAAVRSAKAATRYAKQGNRLLLAAGKLLR